MDIGTQNIDYFKTKAISNSLMSVYIENYNDFVNYWVHNNPLKKKTDDSLKLGSIIDGYLTRPEEGDSRFYIYNGTLPTGQMLSFINELSKTSDCDYNVAYELIKAQNGGKLRDSLDKFKERFEDYRDYYETLLKEESSVVTSQMIQKAKEKVIEVKNNPFTKLLVNIETSQHIEVFYQVEIYTTIDGLPVKGALDKVIVDHKKKRVTVVDFKTSANPFDFQNTVKKYNYFRQGSLYKTLILVWMEEQGIQSYKITDFLYVVISTTIPNGHFTSRLNQNDCIVAEFGGEYKSGYPVKGWREILREINYLTEYGDWRYPYDIVVNNGLLELSLFREYAPKD